MNIFVICSVRGMDDEYRERLETYVAELEADGHVVHLPHRDTNQNATGYQICTENTNAIKNADEVHIFYSSASQGTHFDMGVAFSLGKILKVVASDPITKGKNFPRMLAEWEIARI